MNTPYCFRRCTKCGEWLVASSVNFYKNKSSKWGLKNECKACAKACQKEYNKANKDKFAARGKGYRSSVRGQVVAFNKFNKRRIKETMNGGNITKEQWLECMKYFEFKDAYSGEVLSNETRSLDHIQPVTMAGTNNIWNLVPCTRSNNSSKSNKEMLEWYKEQSFFSEERLNKIYEWQEYAYNKYAKQEQMELV